MLRLTQRQASLVNGTPLPIQLANLISGGMRLDVLGFQLLPASGEQLWRQDGQQASLDVDLLCLCCVCRRLVVVAPLIGLDCACPRCAAQREAEEGGGSGSAAHASVPWRPREDSEYFADALRHAATQLAAPGSLMECVSLRSTAADIAGPGADPDEAAGACMLGCACDVRGCAGRCGGVHAMSQLRLNCGRASPNICIADCRLAGLLFSHCTEFPFVFEFRTALSSSEMAEAAAAANAAASAAAAEGSAAVRISVRGDERVPMTLVMERR